MSTSYLARLETINTAYIGRIGDMRHLNINMPLAFLLGCLVTYVVMTRFLKKEGFQSDSSAPICSDCGNEWPCTDHGGEKSSPSCPTCPTCPTCPMCPMCPACPPVPDMSKYVLKTSIPPCPGRPDMTNYMLKTECPPVPDLSQYVLKSSIPKQQPIIIDTSADVKAKCGDCPPCPRPRCPETKCPPPTVCPTPAPCPRAVCPQTTVKCRAEESNNSPVRPFLAPLGMSGFGQS